MNQFQIFQSVSAFNRVFKEVIKLKITPFKWNPIWCSPKRHFGNTEDIKDAQS
jgi:hypothetical protein